MIKLYLKVLLAQSNYLPTHNKMNKSLLSLVALFFLCSFAIVISGDLPLFKLSTDYKVKTAPQQVNTKRSAKHRLCKDLGAKYPDYKIKNTK